jgi:hypothetical protein
LPRLPLTETQVKPIEDNDDNDDETQFCTQHYYQSKTKNKKKTCADASFLVSLIPKRLYFLAYDCLNRFEAMSNAESKNGLAASQFPSFDYYFYYYHFP